MTKRYYWNSLPFCKSWWRDITEIPYQSVSRDEEILLKFLTILSVVTKIEYWNSLPVCQSWRRDITEFPYRGAGLERRTRDLKVTGSNPCRSGGRIFFSRVDFLCWLLFRYPFHPRVTAVARKRPRSFCQKRRRQVTAKHAYDLTYVALHEVTWCMVVLCTQNAPRWQQFLVAPAMPAL